MKKCVDVFVFLLMIVHLQKAFVRSEWSMTKIPTAEMADSCRIYLNLYLFERF